MSAMLVIDFEGYQNNDTFIFKEIAINDIVDNTYQNFFIKSPHQNSKHYHWLVRHYHHIPHYYGTHSHLKVLKKLDSAVIIFVKGLSKVQILKKFTNTAILNLEDFDCPKLADLPTCVYPLVCDFTAHHSTDHCALKKVHQLSTWLIQLLNDKKIC
jgi:hypothetical protein